MNRAVEKIAENIVFIGIIARKFYIVLRNDKIITFIITTQNNLFILPKFEKFPVSPRAFISEVECEFL